MMRVRVGDQVAVVRGNHRGKRGRVSRILPDVGKVVVEGVNIIVKHIKRGRARQAGRVEMEGPLHVSNVMLICPSCKKPTRVGVRDDASGKNERFCKKCDAAVPRAEL